MYDIMPFIKFTILDKFWRLLDHPGQDRTSLLGTGITFQKGTIFIFSSICEQEFLVDLSWKYQNNKIVEYLEHVNWTNMAGASLQLSYEDLVSFFVFTLFTLNVFLP